MPAKTRRRKKPLSEAEFAQRDTMLLDRQRSTEARMRAMLPKKLQYLLFGPDLLTEWFVEEAAEAAAEEKRKPVNARFLTEVYASLEAQGTGVEYRVPPKANGRAPNDP